MFGGVIECEVCKDVLEKVKINAGFQKSGVLGGYREKQGNSAGNPVSEFTRQFPRDSSRIHL